MTADTTAPERASEEAAGLLHELLQAPTFLEPRHRTSAEDGYQQHLVHVGGEGRYSLVALVWRPGQSTPIHDHRCWCVVGVLEGQEHERRFQLRTNSDDEWLCPAGDAAYEAGAVCTLVPPDEDIHQVRNASTERTISLHVYGTDISVHGTSINRVFDLPVRRHGAGTHTSWRELDATAMGQTDSSVETDR